MYEEGDKVIVRSDLAEDIMYGHNDATDDMVDLAGKEVTIYSVIVDAYDGSEGHKEEYYVEEDLGAWCWTREMFE